MPLPDMIVVGEGPKGETMGTRIARLDAVRSGEGQVIERSTGDSKHVITVDTVSSEHLRLSVDRGELTTKDLERCSGSPLDGENPENGHL